MSLLEPDLARAVIERALRRGGDLAEVYAEERHVFGLGLDDRRVERPQSGDERGAAVRLVSGESSYFGHVDGLAKDDLMRVADSVAEAQAAGTPVDPGALQTVVEATPPMPSVAVPPQPSALTPSPASTLSLAP